jgi:predicted amidohydrolase YtcJ
MARILRADEIPSRIQALRIYASGSAWFAHDDARCGTSTVGKLVDLAVLSKHYRSVPVEEIGAIYTLLILIGAREVYAVGPFAQFK